MQYMGSKKKIAKEILDIILKDRTDEVFVDVFCGGCNLLEKVPPHIPRIGNDNNKYLINMWKHLQEGWQPPLNMTEEEYKDIRLHKENKYAYSLVSFAGFLCSFGGKWFGGFSKNKKNDNYCKRGRNVLLKQIVNLKDVTFYNLDYYAIPLPEKAIIYCDPPYRNVTKYKDSFNHDRFYDWCREKHKQGYKIYISEYDMPEDFKCIWSKEITSTLNKNKKDLKTEKLFTL